MSTCFYGSKNRDYNNMFYFFNVNAKHQIDIRNNKNLVIRIK